MNGLGRLRESLCLKTLVEIGARKRARATIALIAP
jgi:hypothetical protein